MIRKLRNIAIFVVVIIAVFSLIFVRVRIECKSELGECPKDIDSKLQTLNGKYIFQAKSATKRILKNSLVVSDYSTQFKLPNILSVNLIIKKPKFSILDKSRKKYALIDKDGMLLAMSDKSDLPTIVVEENTLQIGKKIDEKYLFALKLIEGVNEMYQIKVGMIENDTLVVDLPNQIRVIFPLNNADRDVLLGSLRLVYTKITTDNKSLYSQIDLRYKNPVLR